MAGLVAATPGAAGVSPLDLRLCHFAMSHLVRPFLLTALLCLPLVAVTAQKDGAAAASCRPERLQWGVNMHVPRDQWPRVADVIAPRGLTQVRLDLWGGDGVYMAQARALASSLARKQIRMTGIMFDSYANGQPKGRQCDADLALVEQNAYRETTKGITLIDDLVHDFELLNEISLYPDILVPGARGEHAGDFDTPCGRMQAANLRGMSRAIADERKRTGLPLRIILGTVGRHFGFYKFMQAQGVSFDVAGYHIYPKEAQKLLDEDPWFGIGGAIGQLAKFNKPIHINEFHCGEIYKPQYENKAGQPETEACLRSVSRHLQAIVKQKVARIEAVHFYELMDEPRKQPPENRFGLMVDLDTPKVGLYLATAFAGGKLSAQEADELTRRQLLTPAQIAAWSGCGARP